LKKIFTLLFVLFTLKAAAQTGVSVPELASCDTTVQRFVKRWNVLGASVAITRNGKLMYERAFGYADLARTTPLRPFHLLRVASVSKSVTGLAIMKLVEQGKISLSHKVFGPAGYLNSPYYSGAVTDERLYDITVQQLLEHTAGWDRTIGCDGFGGCDPIDFPLYVTEAMKASNPVADSTLVRFMLAKGLNYAPGTHYAYSNIGYLVLGKLVEVVAHQSYEKWVREQLLLPSGVLEAHLGHNKLSDRQERESEYQSTGRMLSCYGTGQKVPRAYGGFNLEAMSAHGGWLFSARDLVRLMLAADGFATRPDVLAPATISAMAQPSAVNPGYAKGWQVGPNAWWHTGYLDGSASYLVRTNGGYTWAILLNSSSPDPQFWKDLDRLGWTCVRGVASWPEHDLFTPEQNATGLTTTSLDSTSEQLQWHSGNGTRRLVLLKADSPVDAFPADGIHYLANATFGQGTDLGDGTFVVANTDTNAVLLKGLDPQRTYYVRVVEYAQNAATNGKPMYTVEGNPTLALHEGASTLALSEAELEVYPNPTFDELSIKNLRHALAYDVVNDEGVAVQSGTLEPGSTVGVGSLVPGLYLLRMHAEDKEVVRRFVKE
jgi:CubicO group peptidase (beta-lactamase class C family)